MTKERCKETAMDSFFGHFLYDHKVPQGHFLRQLAQVVDWDRFTQKLLSYYKGRGEVGQAPYDPAVILKMLLLSYLYNLSERQVEVVANDSLSVAYFLGLGADRRVPDHSTLTLFKNRLLEKGGIEAYKGLLDEIIRVAQERGIKFGQLQVVDTVHVVADVNQEKDKKRQKEGKPARDGDATWGVKGKKVIMTPEGKKERRTEYFYGYKDQVSLNAEAEMITTVRAGYGNDYDGRGLAYLVEEDLRKGIPIETVTADRGYDDGENHYFLEQRGINSAIRLRSFRTQKKDPHKEGWVSLQQSPAYQEGLKERYKVERKFGEMKRWHGFGRCHYLGLARHAIQLFLTSIVVDLKRMVKLLTGVSFKGETGARWSGAKTLAG